MNSIDCPYVNIRTLKICKNQMIKRVASDLFYQDIQDQARKTIYGHKPVFPMQPFLQYLSAALIYVVR